MIKLVLTDLDNTLLPSGEEHVSYRAVTAIRDLLELGVRFGPATGRDTFELERMFFGACDCYATGIAANGKRVYVDGELRRYALMDNDSVARLVSLVSETPNAFVTTLAFDNPRGREPYRCIGARGGDMAWFERNIGFVGELCDEVPGENLIATTIACAGTQEQLDDIVRRAREEVPEFDYAQPCEHWVDVLPAGLNKGSALPLLLDELGITSDEVLFFGDADNDVALMGAVEHSVAVANATPAAAAAARWHIGAAEDEAVAEALEELVDALREDRTPTFMLPEGQVRPAFEEQSEADDEYDVTAEAIGQLLAAHLGPELGGEAGTPGGAGGDAAQL